MPECAPGQRISQYKNIHGARQRRYNVRKLKDTEIMQKYKQEIESGLLKVMNNKIIRKKKQVKLNGNILSKY